MLDGPASPRTRQPAEGNPVSYDDQRARWAALRADQATIDRAAARLRHETAQDQYRGLRDPQVAFGLAAILDELSRHLRDIDDEVRRRCSLRKATGTRSSGSRSGRAGDGLTACSSAGCSTGGSPRTTAQRSGRVHSRPDRGVGRRATCDRSR
jgi:CO/xanthine dehydrogenase Mo-binding subunit